MFNKKKKKKKKKEEALKAVRKNGYALRNVRKEFQKDKEVVLVAVKQNGLSLEYCCDELKNDKEVVFEAVKQNGYALQYASENFKNDIKFVWVAMRVRLDGKVYKYVGDSLRNDKELAMEAMKRFQEAFRYVGKELKNDKEVVMEAVKKDGKMLEYVSEALKNDKEVVLVSVEQNPESLQYASLQLCDDKEIVYPAVSRKGRLLRVVSERLRNDKEVVMAAVKSYETRDGQPSVLRYASEELRNDKELLIEALKKDMSEFKNASEKFKNDKEVVLVAVKQGGYALEYASEELRNDKEVVMEALTCSTQNWGKSRVFLHVSEELKNDKEVVMEAVKQDGWSLKYASEALKNDRKVVMEALKGKYKKEDILKLIGNELQKEVEESGLGFIAWFKIKEAEEKEKKMEEGKQEVEQRLEDEKEQWEEERKAMVDENQKMLDSVLDSVGRGFRIHHENLKIDREGKLGKGGFGSVFRAEFTNEHGEKKEVAAKVIGYGFQADGMEVFKEFSRSLQFRHENVIRTFGFDDSRRNEIAIVMEKLDGNIHNYVRENFLTLEQKFEIMKKMVNGIHYLHSMKPKPFLHRDIKGENFLFKVVEEEEGETCTEVKVCDFGLAKAATGTETQVSAVGQGTKLWMAPEVGKGLYSMKSDVYSLGISFWEVLFEEYPYQGYDPNHVFTDVERKGLRPDLNLYAASPEGVDKDNDDEEEDEGEDRSDEDLLLLEEGHLPKVLKKLLKKCWSQDRNERPSTQDLRLWFDDHEMEIFEFGDEYFPPLEVQEEKKKGSNSLTNTHNRKINSDEKTTDDDSLDPNVDQSVLIDELRKEIKRLKMENEEKEKKYKKEIENMRKFMEKNNLLKKYIDEQEVVMND